MGFKVVFTEQFFPDLDIEREILGKAGAEIVVAKAANDDDLIAKATDADALLTYVYKRIGENVIERLERCRIIVRSGIGVDTIDVPAATRRGIIVTNVPSYCVEEVSDLTMALLLSLLLKVPVAMGETRAGRWNRGALKPVRSLRCLTVGIVGLGAIGRTTAHKAAAFGMRILFFDPFVKGDVAVGGTTAGNVSLDELLASSDAVVLHAPATERTRHIVNRETLAKMKRGAVLVNTARGQLVDTDALVEALKSGALAGAGLDLIENVPPLDAGHPLLALPNVIVTPYCAFSTEDSERLLRRTGVEEIARVLAGGLPSVVYNREVLPRARAVRK